MKIKSPDTIWLRPYFTGVLAIVNYMGELLKEYVFQAVGILKGRDSRTWSKQEGRLFKKPFKNVELKSARPQRQTDVGSFVKLG